MNHVSRLALTLTLLVPTAGWAQSDSDGDGVNNSADAYPCDPSVAGVAFVPAEGQHAALHFEDQWPSVGDEDFNDLVLTYNYVVRQDAQGRAVAITATFNPLAVGGVYDNALGLHLPVSASVIGAVTRTVGNNSPQTLSPSTLDTEFTVMVSPNLREFFGNMAGPINVINGGTLIGQAVQVDIQLNTPTALDLTAAPFDVFLARTNDPGHQIHRSMYGGTVAMNTGLFGTQSDRSTPGRAFVDSRNLPFVIDIPTYVVHSQEGVSIAQMWPRILNFAASGGTLDKDFYLGDTVLSKTYSGPIPLQPVLLSALPVASTACIVSDTCDALQFDGTNGSVEVASLDGYAWGNALTIEAWVNWSASGQHRFEEIIRSGDASTTAIAFNITGQVDPNPGCLGVSEVGRVAIVLGNPSAGGACMQTAVPISSNAWHHLAVVYGSSAVTLYVDGQRAASGSAPASLPNAPTPLGIGRNFHSAFRFGGMIDEVRISSTARYSSNFVPNTYFAADPNTVALWHFNEGSGATTTDVSGNSYDGTISGATWTTQSACNAPPPASGCADGSNELGTAAWGRSDIVYCQYPGNPSLPLRISQGAGTHCAGGWHVCTDAEFTSRNDTLGSEVFVATTNDGDNCFVASGGGGLFDARLDTVRSGFAGSCTGNQSNTSWGRQELPACNVFRNNCGVVCCQ